MIFLERVTLDPLTGVFFLVKSLKTCQKSRNALVNKNRGLKKLRGGVLLFLQKFSFFGVSEGGQPGENPSSHVFFYSITVFLASGFYVESHKTAYNRTMRRHAPRVASTPESAPKDR